MFQTKMIINITTMNCNLIISNDYGGLLDGIKKLSTKSH